jgi:glycosyltransferase involved in cell wall biosynthesis
MNILHITTFLQGGAGQIIAALASSQAMSGHKVTVATSATGTRDYGNYPQWLDQLQVAGVDVVLVESTFKRDLSLNVSAFRRIKDILDLSSLSLIHTHAAIPSLVALLLRSGAKREIPIVQTMHGWGIQKSPEQAATDITLMNELDAVVTPSEASRRLLVRLGLASELITVAPYGIPAQSPIREGGRMSLLRKWRSQRLRILVCMGTVGPRKNQRLLLEAIADAHAPQNIACALVGEGEAVAELEAIARESGIGERVHFFGYQPEGSEFLASADWLILPSNDEGLPLSILEAYRAGVPVVGSDIPEIAEVIVPDKTGILFRAGNEESLVLALAKLADMPENERVLMGVAAKKLYEECYSLNQMFDQYTRIYQHLILK